MSTPADDDIRHLTRRLNRGLEDLNGEAALRARRIQIPFSGGLPELEPTAVTSLVHALKTLPDVRNMLAPLIGAELASAARSVLIGQIVVVDTFRGNVDRMLKLSRSPEGLEPDERAVIGTKMRQSQEALLEFRDIWFNSLLGPINESTSVPFLDGVTFMAILYVLSTRPELWTAFRAAIST